MLDPLTICQRAESFFEENDQIPINAAEGFIRQILGWREYMRGIYWERMPEFGEENFFGHSNKLPDWFWNGETKMKMYILHYKALNMRMPITFKD